MSDATSSRIDRAILNSAGHRAANSSASGQWITTRALPSSIKPPPSESDKASQLRELISGGSSGKPARAAAKKAPRPSYREVEITKTTSPWSSITRENYQW